MENREKIFRLAKNGKSAKEKKSFALFEEKISYAFV
jgi:hypothetical protein